MSPEIASVFCGFVLSIPMGDVYFGESFREPANHYEWAVRQAVGWIPSNRMFRWSFDRDKLIAHDRLKGLLGIGQHIGGGWYAVRFWDKDNKEWDSILNVRVENGVIRGYWVTPVGQRNEERYRRVVGSGP